MEEMVQWRKSWNRRFTKSL